MTRFLEEYVSCFQLRLTDVNGDHKPDFVVSVNNGPVNTFLHTGPKGEVIIQVKLFGPSGNSEAIGARVVLRSEDGSSQTAEVFAGGGYLSQSGGALYFGLGESSTCKDISVRWPDGTHTQHPFDKAWTTSGICEIHHADRQPVH